MKLFLQAVFIALMSLTSMSLYAVDESAPQYEGIEVKVNINSADAEQLATLLKGIGIEKAKRIVSYREQHGNFMVIDDLSKVKGIGQTTVNKNRERIELHTTNLAP